MKARHDGRADETGTEYVHAFVEAVIDNEVVGHADSVGFHGVALAVVVVTYFGVVEVGYAAGGGRKAGHCHFVIKVWLTASVSGFGREISN